MNIEEINQLIKEVKAKNVIIPKIIIERNALEEIPIYLEKEAFRNIIIVVDKNTKRAAGSKLKNLLSSESNRITTINLKPNRHNQVIADEQTLIQLLVETPNNTDVILAVGSGTIHDVVRFVGHKMNIPFISVPTAASVDGFTSKGAPLIFRGFKQTIQTASPLAVFADIEVLRDAPQELTAAGFGDIVGKYTSLVDWKISSFVANEPYNTLAADLTRKSLDSCVNNLGRIAKHTDDGLKVLIQSLIESGLVMLVLDFSRPASGGEHHLSHYWEMNMLKNDRKQLLHGAKVGVATTIIIDLYKRFIIKFDEKSILSDYESSEDFLGKLQDIKRMIDELPDSAVIRKYLSKIGGPATTKELNIDDQLVADSLNEAFRLRDRCTGLFLINKFKKETIKFPMG